MNIFTLLDNIKKRPNMYIKDKSLKDLEALIAGYYMGLYNHKIVENVPEMTHHFSIWILSKYGWSTSTGWANAIIEHSEKQNPFDLFFKIIDKYRKIEPIVLAEVKLHKSHQPTGKKVVIGFGEKMKKPLKIEIVRYKPEKLHLLRFHYEDYIYNGWFLMRPDGSHDTSLDFIKNWAQEELQIKHDEWKNKATSNLKNS